MDDNSRDEFGCRKGSFDSFVMKGLDRASFGLGILAILGAWACAAAVGNAWGGHVAQRLAAAPTEQAADSVNWGFWMLIALALRLL